MSWENRKNAAHRGGAVAWRQSVRPIGREFRPLAWLLRHPGSLVAPVLDALESGGRDPAELVA
jgi:hypothetical protein